MVVCKHLIGLNNGWCVVCGVYVGRLEQRHPKDKVLFNMAKAEYERLKREVEEDGFGV